MITHVTTKTTKLDDVVFYDKAKLLSNAEVNVAASYVSYIDLVADYTAEEGKIGNGKTYTTAVTNAE
jgi:hypothetical protein